MQRTLRETTGVGWNYLAMGRKNRFWGQSSLGGSAFISGGVYHSAGSFTCGHSGLSSIHARHLGVERREYRH